VQGAWVVLGVMVVMGALVETAEMVVSTPQELNKFG